MHYNRDFLLNAPKVKRTHCYVQHPGRYDIFCPICGGTNTTWSEYEKHIWCYNCNEDVYIPLNESGIFSGPIPWGICHVFGTNFGRINLVTGQIDIPDNGDEWDDAHNKAFGDSFVDTDELREYAKHEEENEIRED